MWEVGGSYLFLGRFLENEKDDSFCGIRFFK